MGGFVVGWGAHDYPADWRSIFSGASIGNGGSRGGCDWGVDGWRGEFDDAQREGGDAFSGEPFTRALFEYCGECDGGRSGAWGVGVDQVFGGAQRSVALVGGFRVNFGLHCLFWAEAISGGAGKFLADVEESDIAIGG